MSRMASASFSSCPPPPSSSWATRSILGEGSGPSGSQSPGAEILRVRRDGADPISGAVFFLPQRGIEATTSLLRQPYFLKREEGGREEPRQPRGTPRNQLSGTLQICFMLLLNVDASFFSLVSAAAHRILPGKSSVLLRMRKKGFPPQRNKKRENKTENKEK